MTAAARPAVRSPALSPALDATPDATTAPRLSLLDTIRSASIEHAPDCRYAVGERLGVAVPSPHAPGGYCCDGERAYWRGAELPVATIELGTFKGGALDGATVVRVGLAAPTARFKSPLSPSDLAAACFGMSRRPGTWVVLEGIEQAAAGDPRKLEGSGWLSPFVTALRGAGYRALAVVPAGTQAHMGAGFDRVRVVLTAAAIASRGGFPRAGCLASADELVLAAREPADLARLDDVLACAPIPQGADVLVYPLSPALDGACRVAASVRGWRVVTSYAVHVDR